ncbi:CHAT domain-containing protein [Kitasatospora sp. NPDC015120]|uniref:CHAT domain-containing protein n=1 Tax=Kitasatospora sp. NPDC015120 TaxID=3364023 RepID=UPI0036F45A98
MTADPGATLHLAAQQARRGQPFPLARQRTLRRLAAAFEEQLDREEDLAARSDLGWVHLGLSEAASLTEDERSEALQAALGSFALCRLSGIGDVPHALAGLMPMAVLFRAQRFFMMITTDPDPGTAARAIGGIDRLVRLAGTGHPEYADLVKILCIAVQARLGITDAPAEVERAAAVLEPLVTDGATAAVWLAHGQVLGHRFEQTGDLRDADRAIRSLRRGIALTPADDPDRPGYLSNLAVVLMLRFEQTWSLDDLDTAIEIHQQVLAAFSDDDPNAAALLLNVGAALTARFERSGSIDDVDTAVDWLRESVRRATPGDEVHRRALTTLAGALLLRYRRESRPEDAEAALTHAGEARRRTPADHADQPLLAFSVAAVLHSRFERHPQHDPADLDRAVELFRQALVATDPGHPSWPEYVIHLTAALQQRYDRTRDLADPALAVDLLRPMTASVERGGPRHALGLVRLGTALIHLGAAASDPDASRAAFAEAAHCLTQAADSPTAQASLRIDAARFVALITSKADPALGARLLAQAVGLLPQVAPRFIHRGDQQQALGGFFGLAADAAALTLAARPGDPGRGLAALRLLESGRALMLGQLLHSRTDLTALRDHRPDLADRFEQLRRLLDTDEVGLLNGGVLPATGAEPPELATRQRLLRDFTATVEEIRALDGFASFLRPVPAERLFEAAAEGPVVVFNVSRFGSAALVLTPSGVRVLPLPGLTPEVVAERTAAFRTAVAATADDDPEVSVPAQQRLVGLLEWLWDAAAGPVLDALGPPAPDRPGAALPRVWWCPGGLLGQLPLHAAGHHRAGAATAPDGPRRTVLDRAVSSYTPTVQALLHARRPAPSAAAGRPDAALLVAMPSTPGQPDLDHALDEVEAVRELLPLPSAVLAPAGPDGAGADPAVLPTAARVRHALGSAAVAHLVCHGISEAADPSHSRLLLHDHLSSPFTVLSLAPLDLDGARLAYLSACETAVSTNDDLADESIHLASAFQLMGFRQVIGTLWKAYDDESDAIASAFYRGLLRPDGGIDYGRAAAALHTVVRERRDALPGTPSLWAAHLHVGA